MELLVKIVERIVENADTSTLILKPVSGSFEYLSGQFITLIFNDLGSKEIRRSYSFSSAPHEKNIAITIKKQRNGLVSRFLAKDAPVGSVLRALPPSGRFTLKVKEKKYRKIFLIGGGSGITPLFSILKTVLQSSKKTKITLVYANKNWDSTIFKDQLLNIQRQFPKRFNIYFLFSSFKKGWPQSLENHPTLSFWTGHLTNELLESLVKKHSKYPKPETGFYLCGPSGLMQKAFITLRYMGFESKQIHREIFTVKSVLRPLPELFPKSKVLLDLEDNQVEILVDPGKTILEAAESSGLQLPFSCRSGICTTCSGECISGNVAMYTQEGQFDADNSDGLVLTCVGYPLTEKVRIKFT